jgi:transposase-like protein
MGYGMEVPMRRKRRSFTPEFKAQIVRLVLEDGKSICEVAQEHDLMRTSVYDWVERAKTDAGHGPPDALTTSERDELQRLRRENKRLQMEREILKKATAFFAKEST